MSGAHWSNPLVHCDAVWPQVHERNSGRDPFPIFVKRGPLPREKPRGATMTGRIPKSLCYKPEDLRLGSYINVHGRDFLIHDCDAATREWYKVGGLYPSNSERRR